MKALVTGGLLLLCACAQHARPTDPKVAKREEQGQDLYECRVERQTGTIISERVCRRRADIESDRDASQKLAETITRRGTQQIKRDLNASGKR